jgi:serine/threonine protein kinase
MPSLIVQGRTLRVGGTFTIGRNKTCNLSIGHGSISREHARIWCEAGTWMVEDLHSANGTTVNGRPLLAGAAKLADGDVIMVGDIETRWQVAEELRLDLPPATDNQARDPATLPGTTFAGYDVHLLERQEVAGPLFRAKHHKTAREVFLWVLDPRIERQEEGGFYERFLATLSIAASLKHPELTRVYQVGRDDGLIWYATEPAAGATLAQLVHHGFTPAQAVERVVKLCRLLDVYHAAGLIHGDIKPSLVHVDESRRVRLGSLGLAGLSSQTRKALQSEGSTRQVFYLCPVQARTGDCNVKSDLYSIGCLFVHLLIGRPPFVGSGFAEVMAAHRDQPVPVLSGALNMPVLIDEILAGMLAKDPFERYDDLGPLIRDLETLAGQLSG